MALTEPGVNSLRDRLPPLGALQNRAMIDYVPQDIFDLGVSQTIIGENLWWREVPQGRVGIDHSPPVAIAGELGVLGNPDSAVYHSLVLVRDRGQERRLYRDLPTRWQDFAESHKLVLPPMKTGVHSVLTPAEMGFVDTGRVIRNETPSLFDEPKAAGHDPSVEFDTRVKETQKLNSEYTYFEEYIRYLSDKLAAAAGNPLETDVVRSMIAGSVMFAFGDGRPQEAEKLLNVLSEDDQLRTELSLDA